MNSCKIEYFTKKNIVIFGFKSNNFYNNFYNSKNIEIKI